SRPEPVAGRVAAASACGGIDGSAGFMLGSGRDSGRRKAPPGAGGRIMLPSRPDHETAASPAGKPGGTDARSHADGYDPLRDPPSWRRLSIETTFRIRASRIATLALSLGLALALAGCGKKSKPTGPLGDEGGEHLLV